MNKNNPYQVLEVAENASDEEIRKIYLDKIKQFHPDKFVDGKEKKEAEEKCKEINAAYEQINTQEKRANFNHQQPFGFDMSGGDFNEVINNLFKQFGNVGRFGFGGGGHFHQEVTRSLDVDVESAFHGCEKEFYIEGKKIKLQIKPGINNHSGFKIKVNDNYVLNLVVNLVDSQNIKIKNIERGETLSEVVVPFWMPIIGGEATVDVFGEKIKVKVPSDRGFFQHLILKYKGYYFDESRRGDHTLYVIPEFPKKVTKKEEGLYRQLRGIYGEKK